MTDIVVSFKIPTKAFEVLKIVAEQNETVEFYLNPDDGSLTIVSDLYDFSDYQDDWDDLDEIEALINE